MGYDYLYVKDGNDVEQLIEAFREVKDKKHPVVVHINELPPCLFAAVYVPPSNVLSEEGRKLLEEKFPEIRSIASNYFSGEFAYVQEFETADGGTYTDSSVAGNIFFPKRINSSTAFSIASRLVHVL